LTIEFTALKISTIEEGLKFWTDIIGVNVAPWDTRNKQAMLGTGEYEPWQSKPIPNEIMQHWIRNNLFDKGFQIYLGKMHHAYGDIKNYYLACIDLDNKTAIKEFCNINGKQYTLEELSELGFLVEQHGDIHTAHIYLITEEPLKKKDSKNKAITGELNENIPRMEIKPDGTCRVSVTPCIHEDGTPYRLIGNHQKFTNDLSFQNKDTIEQHLDKILRKYNIEYLNGDASNKNYISVVKKQGKILNGERHDTLLSYANSIILKLYKTTNRETIWEYFKIYNNTECVEPLGSKVGPNQQKELKELKDVFDDAWKERVTKNQQYTEQKENDETKREVLSVLEALSIHEGNVTVLGTIVSKTKMYVIDVPCTDNPAVEEHKDVKFIQLEDTENLDTDEQLNVTLYGIDNIKNVRPGEIVEVSGNMTVEEIKKYSKSKKKHNVLHATSIKYLNRKEFVITEKDIETFNRFIKFPNPIDRLTSMFAPNIVEHDDVKRGLLRAIVGGVNRGKDSSGRLDTLMSGDIGTAKSRLAAEAAELKPNSRHVSAPHSTTKTITAVPERINEIPVLRLGAIPLSRGALCAIDEINVYSMEDQSILLDVIEDSGFNFDKMGIRQFIAAPTTIIATTNPVGGNWNSSEVASKDELELKKSLLDRFTQIYTFRDNMDENQIEDFVKEMNTIRRRKPHNYNFLRKYLIHASSIKDVTFTKSAEQKLNQFWIKAKLKKSLSFRMYKGIYKIAEAQAKLQLKNIVDDEIVNQIIEDIQLMMVQYGEAVEQFIGLHELTLNTFLEVIRENHPTPMKLESICEKAIQKNDRIGSYIGYIWKLRFNWKLKNVVDSLLNNRNIIRIQEKPIVLQFLCDGCVLCEGKRKITLNENDEKCITKPVIADNLVKEPTNNDDVIYQTASHTTHTTHSDEKEGL